MIYEKDVLPLTPDPKLKLLSPHATMVTHSLFMGRVLYAQGFSLNSSLSTAVLGSLCSSNN